VCCLLIIVSMMQRKVVPVINGLVIGAVLLIGFLRVKEIPEPLTQSTPYVATLIVLAIASRRLRPPAHAGLPYRSGEGH
jgi:simple sugar transport system permease protein